MEAHATATETNEMPMIGMHGGDSGDADGRHGGDEGGGVANDRHV